MPWDAGVLLPRMFKGFVLDIHVLHKCLTMNVQERSLEILVRVGLWKLSPSSKFSPHFRRSMQNNMFQTEVDDPLGTTILLGKVMIQI